jgi:hypothetical protein
MALNSINFDLPDEPIIPYKKTWNIQPSLTFTKQRVKAIKLGKNQTRLPFPKTLIDAYNIDSNYNAYFILYRAEMKLILILSKNMISDADFKRAISPIGSGLYFTVIPPKLLNYLNIEEFPDYIWLCNTEKSTKEDIILELCQEG